MFATGEKSMSRTIEVLDRVTGLKTRAAAA
jgi:hypothetical protein